MRNPLRFPISLAVTIGGLSLLGCQPIAPSGSDGDEIDTSPVSTSNDCSSPDLKLHVPSPDWQDQIIFFIFTDRFADGDPSNNDLGHGEFNPDREHYFSGGDIAGITSRLDYIEGLGATAIWSTPIVLNQWKSQGQDFTGYSGYYGIDFTAVDPHFGTLQDYQALSHALHCRDMYLIKDIVVNHTANFFGYDGVYDPENTARNFFLFQDETSPQPAPLQSPFHKIDRNNPEHFAAEIYNWTPTITDYQNMGERQFTHQLGSLADINTKNPVVIETFKQTYGDWIEKAGIDAIRIDTVRYVKPEFFTQFMSDENGIAARAKATGRDDFLVFGEVLDYSQPFENSGEKALAEYLSTPDREILPAVISFPLKQEIKSVFGQGKPTAQIAYRLEQHMEMFPNPYVTPTLVDNHDVARFLASGSADGFKQAFALIFTIPGIPTIYQGSAQGFTETRQAMFAGGYLSDQDHFNTETELYTFIASLSDLRKSEVALRRGSFEVLASNSHQAGLVAYRREHGTDILDVFFNTSDQSILVDNLTLPGLKDGPLDLVYALNFDGLPEVRDRQLTAILPPRAFFVSRGSMSTESSGNNLDNLSQTKITTRFPEDTALTSDFELVGSFSGRDRDLLIVKNGSLEGAIPVKSDANGNWSYSYPVENLGEESFYLVAYDPETWSVSERLNINTNVTEPTISITVPDPRGDDVGPAGRYVDMQQANAIGQKDILETHVAVGGDVLEIEFSMAEVTSEWLPPNQFDNVSFSIFFDLPGRDGIQPLPQLNASMPGGLDWDTGHVVFGWGNTMFSAEGANDDQAGTRYSSAPSIHVNEERRSIKFINDGSDFGVSDWQGTNIYVTTWDIAGEGAYVKLAPEPGDWTFGGGEEGDPRILDDLIISLGDAK